ncbi:MAG: polyprenyl synthetase family protein [Lactococcus raffinolactis]|jgi:geranylgeranyl diphosphate synthase type II|uniref:Farnesyl diphosphate synthase n=1 Tax=Pseudolactococcus raffinolactis TaxID=1366 RepID=A0A290Q890_9LACT|nr:farnesyl diphosphate synthase [Lactococcus raffinolactis]ATC60591.1 geranyl transferase [Lactococcus raffinolactis]MBW9331248.1 polyprenyl synthetase family protein [Lactococcus raffinolactis]MDG4961580.1 polyprenyl synthetase family protein [Lactococcus raffinolactis]MDN5414936.1 polyprenyl synthetase family protein [Lactococcus raffinolactis]MDN5467297.1 polyprenyl synthetase family protein [Lactococcus raffinolactis]
MDNKALLTALTTIFDGFYAADDLVDHLTQSIQYSIQAGGKRIRPLFLLETLQAFGVTITTEHLKVAGAVELIHTSSLIHDDLPAMDNDDFRRGKPTNHKVFGEAQAILAGDALLLDPYLLLANADLPSGVVVALVKELALASGSHGMVAGQVLDMDGETQALTFEQLKQIHALKTGKMLTFPFVAAGLIAQQSNEVILSLRNLGEKVGQAFQIRDDILDVTATFDQIGKTPGKDEVADKSTYVKLLGLAGAKAELSANLAAAEGILAELSHTTQLVPDSILKQIERLKID